MPAVAAACTPLVYLAVRTGSAEGHVIAEQLTRPRFAELFANSLLLAGVVTLGCLIVGTATAFLVSRTDVAAPKAMHLLATLPLAIPTYVAGFTWRSTFPGWEGFWPAALVLVAASFPYVHLPVSAALRRVDPALEEMSRSLGHGPIRTFFAVTLRQVTPALIGGGLLAGLYVLSDFGAVSIMRFDTFTTAIFGAFRLGFDRTAALVLATALAVLTIMILSGEWLVTSSARKARYSRADGGAARPPVRHSLKGKRTAVYLAMTALGTITLGVPAASLVRWNIAGVSSPESLGRVASAAATSLGVSALAAALTMALAIPVGVYVARRHGLFAAVSERVVYVGHALPGIVVGLSLVFMAIQIDWIYFGFYQTTPLLIFGYAVIFLPLGMTAVKAAAAQSPPSLAEVARSLGKRPAGVFRTVTFPLIAPGVAAGAALVFLTAMKELPATLLLRPPGMDTLATQLWSSTTVAAYSAAAPYAALLVVLSAIPTWLLASRFGSRI